MRHGFTTGSCATAAATAAAYLLVAGERKERVDVVTPKGVVFHAEILDLTIADGEARCGVMKDGGDDPDVTTGAVVYAAVSRAEGDGPRVVVDGGEGVGRVTKPGLDQPVGAAAINSGPRKTIETAVLDVMERFGERGILKVVVSIPGGEEIAAKTFNPRFGIVGGISVLGTSGVVEPMSSQALLDTIRVELRQNRALGMTRAAVAPGNYGLDFMRETFGFDLDRAAKCSNYIGDTIDMAAELGFTELVLCGHIGKLIKTSGGVMNTHSKEGDCRMELIAAAAIRAGMPTEGLARILDCVSTDAALEIVREYALQDAVMNRVMEKIDYWLNRRAAGRLRVEAIVFSNVYGLLGTTPGAAALLESIRDEIGAKTEPKPGAANAEVDGNQEIILNGENGYER